MEILLKRKRDEEMKNGKSAEAKNKFKKIKGADVSGK